MTRPVVDSSIATAWCSKSQATAISDAALERAIEHGAVVPSHFGLEVANSLWQLERRDRMDGAAVDAFLAFLGQITIDIDNAASSIVQPDVLHLARRYDLTTYDAAYLELALRTGLPLATRDATLAAAAENAGATLLTA
jgi:predicted nucleic acid-binding protein